MAELMGELLADGDAHLLEQDAQLLRPMRELWQFNLITHELSLCHQIVYPAGTL